MKRTTLLSVLLLAAALPAQKPVQDPLLPKQLDLLHAAVKDKKMQQDNKAIGILEDLVAVAEKPMHKKDQRRAAKAVGKVFFLGKRRPHDAPRLYRAAAQALAALGDPGARQLVTIYDREKRFPSKKEWRPLRATLLRSTGKTAEVRHADFLLETATRSPHNELMAAAGEALGHYGKAPLKLRMKMVKVLVRMYGSLESMANQTHINLPGETQNFDPQNARATLAAVAAKWNRSLGQLSGQSHRRGADWQHWLNKGGKNPKNWKK